MRKIAEEVKLPVAAKKDSVGICFIGKRNFKDFIGKKWFFSCVWINKVEYLPVRKGEFFDIETNKPIAAHGGAHLFTIGECPYIGGLKAK